MDYFVRFRVVTMSKATISTCWLVTYCTYFDLLRDDNLVGQGLEERREEAGTNEKNVIGVPY
jgi:hypothetical protein